MAVATTTTITGSNTFNGIGVYASSTVILTAGTTQTLIISLSISGSTGNLCSLQSSSGGNAATLSSALGVISLYYTNIKDITATGGASFVANNSINTSGNTGWTFTGVAPSYNTSIITAVARLQQGFAVPKFIMGGTGGAGATTFALYKQSTTYGLNIWRSRPFVLPQQFSFSWLRLRLSTPVTTGIIILPSLRFDDATNVVYGTVIKPQNYANNEQVIYMTSDNFSGTTIGQKNVVLELDFQGSTLCAVELPITMMLETLDIQTSG